MRLRHNIPMPLSQPESSAPANPHKARTGLNRIWHAAGYSIEGLRAGWNEKAFRQEAIAALMLLPAGVSLIAHLRPHRNPRDVEYQPASTVAFI